MTDRSRRLGEWKMRSCSDRVSRNDQLIAVVEIYHRCVVTDAEHDPRLGRGGPGEIPFYQFELVHRCSRAAGER